MMNLPYLPGDIEDEWLPWAQQEFEGAGLGDARLDKRLIQIAGAFMNSPQSSIPGSCGGWAGSKAAYRFFDNEKVEPGLIVERHRKNVLERAESEPVVLALGDTTMLDYTNHPYAIGLGPLSDVNHQGMLVQPCLVVTPHRVPLGIIDLQTWVRDFSDFGNSKDTKDNRPIEEKESFKWMESLQAAERFQQEIGDETQVVSVFDREGDIFDVLHAATTEGQKSRILIRAKNDRAVKDDEDHVGHLWDILREKPIVETLVVTQSRQRDQKGREATVSVRFSEISISAPRRRPKSAGRNPISAFAVFVHEDNPPKGVDPISWMLLTTVPVRTVDDALQIVSWYACRWMIEILFKVLKSGCESEERQLETYKRLERCLAVDIIVAWRILFLTTVGRDTPDLPCTVVFDEQEWKALWVFVYKSPEKIPQDPPSLREVSRTIGRLGGHLGRKQDGEPGVVTMWRGLQRLPDITKMWIIFNQKSEKHK